MTSNSSSKVIGYFAFASRTEVFCDGDSCVIAGSEADLLAYMSKLNPAQRTLKKTRFSEILQGLRLGAAYSFDETAYNRFYPLAKTEGIELGPEDFYPAPTGMHFVRVQIK